MRRSDDAIRSVKRYLAHALGSDWEVRLWTDDGTFKRPFARVARSGPVLATNLRSAVEVVMPLAIHLYPQEQTTVELGIALAEAAEELLFQAFEIGVSYQESLEPPSLVDPDAAATGGTLATATYHYVVTARKGTGESLPSLVVSEPVVGPTGSVLVTWLPVGEATSYRVYRAAAAAGPFGLIATVTPMLPPVGVPPPEGAYSLRFLDAGAVAPGAAPPTVAGATITRRGHPRRVPLYDHASVPWTGAEANTTDRFEHDYLRVLDLSVNRLHDPVDERLISVVCDLRCGYRRLGRVPSGKNIVKSVNVTDSAIV